MWLQKNRVKLVNNDLFSDGSDRRIYINENLTPYIKKLLWQVKVKAKDMSYKFVWVKNGKIFVRKEQGSFTIKISCEGDIIKIK